MLPEITIDDFKGAVKISLNDFIQTDFQDYINEYTVEYINEYLGGDACYEIENNDYQRWDDLMLGVNYKNKQGKWSKLRGYKKALVYFIYYHYVNDFFTMTEVGAVSNLNENSRSVPQYQIANHRWNSIYKFIDEVIEFLDNYCEIREVITSSTENLGVYTLTVDCTLYLQEGDTVEINDVEYIVSNLVPNVSFNITADSGLDFTSDEVIYKPYSSVDMDKLKSFKLITI